MEVYQTRFRGPGTPFPRSEWGEAIDPSYPAFFYVVAKSRTTTDKTLSFTVPKQTNDHIMPCYLLLSYLLL